MNNFNPKSLRHRSILLTISFAIGIALMCVMVASDASSEERESHEITIDKILTGIAAVETGVERRGLGDIRGKWKVGQAGEVSCFQISPAVLSDLGFSGRTARVHGDPVLAESVARLWLTRLYQRHGDWRIAIAAWNAGSRAHQSRQARSYADRVIAIAEAL